MPCAPQQLWALLQPVEKCRGDPRWQSWQRLPTIVLVRKRPHRIQVIVELDPLREPISGRVADTTGERQAVSGWLDLMDVLDRARSVSQ